jgi:demethylmenaquinone methyltransferase/2-methoxy-6-polyprenyl-1,4-benzoquinol methylase
MDVGLSGNGSAAADPLPERDLIAPDPTTLTMIKSGCYHPRMVRAEKSSMTSRPDGPAQAVSTWSGQAREQAVQRMFTAIAGVYDLNNTLLSFGLHYRWKRLTATYVPAVTTGRALDIGAGTADLALLIEPKMGESGHVVASDLNHAMLAEGLRKVAERGLHKRITCLQANAEQLSFPDEMFHAVTTGFCMRNVGNLPQAFAEIRRVLRPNGRFVCLEFSHPSYAWLRTLYDWYSFRLLPWIGTKVARDRTGVYEYLPASIRTFPNQQRLAALLREAGFRQVEYHNLTGGIVAIHVATK